MGDSAVSVPDFTNTLVKGTRPYFNEAVKNAPKVLAQDEQIDRWLDPNYKLTDDEVTKAKKTAEDFMRQFDGMKMYEINNYMKEHPEAEEEYNRMKQLVNKTWTPAQFGTGFGKAFTDAVNSMGNLLLNYGYDKANSMVPVGAALAGDVNAAKDVQDLYAQQKQSVQDSWNDVFNPINERAQQAKTQSPIAYGAGNAAGKMSQYMLTNPAFDALGASAGLGKAGQFVANQVGQNAQDLLLDTLPTYEELKRQGISGNEIGKELAGNIGLNAAMNLGMGALGELPGTIGNLKGSTTRDAIGAAANYDVGDLTKLTNELQDVQTGAKNIVEANQIPKLDDTVESAVKNADEVVKTADTAERAAVDTVDQNVSDIMNGERPAHKFTQAPVTDEYQNAIKKLDNNEPITREEYYNIPEVIEAKRKADELAASYGVKNSNDIETPERIAARDSIYNEMQNMGSATLDESGKVVYSGDVAREHRADIVIGYPASGKSSAVVDPISQKYKSKLIDSDEALKLLPEQKTGYADDFLHEEAKRIIKKTLDDALEKGENIVYPIFGGNYNSLARKIANLKDAGYTVHVHLNDFPVNKAAGRNMRRWANDGRFLDLFQTSFKEGNDPSGVYELIKKEGLADGFSKVSNDVPKGQFPIQSEGEPIDFKWKSKMDSRNVETGNIGNTPKNGRIASTVPGDGRGRSVRDGDGYSKYGKKTAKESSTGNPATIMGPSDLPDADTGIPSLPKEGVSKVRTNTLQNSGVYNEEELTNLISAEDFKYLKQTEKDSLSQARTIVDTNPEQAIERYTRDYADKEIKQFGASDVDAMMMLQQNLLEAARAATDPTEQRILSE